MRLNDLEPRWVALESGGPVVGLGFQCPHCLTERLAVLFHHSGNAAIAEEGYIRAHNGDRPEQYIWTLAEGSTFGDMTLTPSIDASKSGHWHGFITNGEIR